MKKPIQFGKYYLLDRVNVGGMAEVFKAKSVGVEGFERLLAVKRILPNIAEDQEFITMFIDEAKIAVQLNHANIAQIFDLGKVDESYFIAMEYVHGKDLRALFDRCKQKPEGGVITMPIAQACFVIMKVCEGLDYAHNKRDPSGNELHLVHRDVSPQNVLISYEGEVKLIDFGIAKAAGKVSKTQAGILKGKFGYMSPEQVRGLPLDRRSDIFAVGICLYEVLTGERLFVGESDFSTLEKVRNVEILPPSAYNRKIPEELERIVLKALAKDVEDRYQNPIDLHDDLQAFMYTSGEFYSRKDLAAWMKRVWAQEIQTEGARIDEYRSLPSLEDAVKSSPAPKKTPSGKPQTGAGSKQSPHGGGGDAGHSGGGRGAKKDKEKDKDAAQAGGGFEGEMTEAQVEGELSWDDEETETHVYNLPTDAGDAVEYEEEVDDDEPLPSVEEMGLSDDGAPVPAKAPPGAPPKASASPPAKDSAPPTKLGKNGARLTPASPIPAVQSAGMVATAIAPLPSERESLGSFGKGNSEVTAPTVEASAGDSGRTPYKAPGEGGSRALMALVTKGAAPGESADESFSIPDLAGIKPSMETATPVITGSHAIYRPPAKKKSQMPLFAGVGGALLIVALAGVWIVSRPTVGEVQLTVEPSDGVRFTVDKAPITLEEAAHLKRPAGTYYLVADKDGYKAWADRIDLRAGDTLARRITLEPLPRAGFTMVTDPAGATVTLDGKQLGGVTPFKVEGISPGSHLIEVKAQNKVWNQTVSLEPGTILELKAILAAPTAPAAAAPAPVAAPVAAAPPPVAAAPAPAAAPPPAAVPAAAPAPEPAKPEPKHAAAASDNPKPAGESQSHTRLPRPPPVAEREHEPAKPAPAPAPKLVEKPAPAGGDGFLRLGSKPWTNISIDGRDFGHTPQLKLSLTSGKHKITLTNPQFGISDTFPVEIKNGLTETVIKNYQAKTEDSD